MFSLTTAAAGQSSNSVLFSPLPSPPSTPGHTSTPTPSQHTLTPLTISAHDIDGGSKDFTEYVSGRKDKENVTNTPKNRPIIPLRVRISAKKLREIQSPYESSYSSQEDGSPLVKGAWHQSVSHTHPTTSAASPLVSVNNSLAVNIP